MDALSSNVKRAIKSIIASENFISPLIEISSGSQSGDGFASKSCAITITGSGKTIHIFVKYFPDSVTNMQTKLFKSIFDTELRFYEVIYPKLLQFQREKGVKDIFDNVSKHYVANISRDGIPPIILSNLRADGYVLRDIIPPADGKHISLVMTTYAKFHATSLAMRDQDPEEYKKIDDGVEDTYAEKFGQVGMADTTISLIKGLIQTFDPVADKILIDKCTEFYGTLMEFVSSIPNFVDKYSTICHGDCWSNNMMFLYDKKTGDPIDIKLLDWQVNRTIPLGLEAGHVFYGLARKKVLENFEHYRTLYYNTLANHITELGSDPEKLYPKQIFLEQWKKFAKFGLIISFTVNRVGFLCKDDITDLVDNDDGKMPLFSSNFKEKDQYHQTMRDIVEHFIKNDFL